MDSNLGFRVKSVGFRVQYPEPEKKATGDLGLAASNLVAGGSSFGGWG